MKKNLKDVATDLATLAAPLPSQHVPTPELDRSVEKEKFRREALEAEVQFSFSIPASVRKALTIKAVEADMTMRGFILSALRAQGIEVADEVIADAKRKD